VSPVTALTGPFHLLVVVLLVSGAGKLVRPSPAADAMDDARLPLPLRGRPVTGQALGAVEIAVGSAALAAPAWWSAAAVGVVYAGFAGFVWLLRSRGGDAGCGCFGASSTPPGRPHLVLDLAAAAVGAAVAVAGAPDIVDVFSEGPGVAVPYLTLLAVGAAVVLTGPALVTEIARTRTASLPRTLAPVAGRPR
jgi:hypothetical protein